MGIDMILDNYWLVGECMVIICWWFAAGLVLYWWASCGGYLWCGTVVCCLRITAHWLLLHNCCCWWFAGDCCILTAICLLHIHCVCCYILTMLESDDLQGYSGTLSAPVSWAWKGCWDIGLQPTTELIALLVPLYSPWGFHWMIMEYSGGSCLLGWSSPCWSWSNDAMIFAL